jgi:hypothetical protein
MCNHLSVITETTFSRKSASTPQFPDTADAIETDLSTWEHARAFAFMADRTRDEHLPAFPLCDHCAEIGTEHAIRLSDLMKQFVANVASISKYGDDFNRRVLPDPEPLSPFHMRVFTKPPETADAEQTPPLNPVAADREPDPAPLQRQVSPKFAQLAAFRLAIIGPFAAINSLRIGRLNSVNVPLPEIQNGLFLLCRFLAYQMRTVGLDPGNVRIGATIQFVTADGIFELKIPKHSKECDRFNLALVHMMALFDAVFSSAYMRRMRPANLIDIGKRTISGESFLYSKSEPALFTRAMRKLVVNMKTIQAYQTIFAS